jgi:beta-fructofuranosidase
MYRPLTFYDELGDVEIIEHDNKLHLFHLTLPNRDLIAHAVSDDGLSWKALPMAIRTGDPGSCDDDMIRTMSVTKHNNLFYMLYTAASRAEGGRFERVALATSKDLIKWEKHTGNPIGEADGKYYEAEVSLSKRAFWRDPKPYYENGIYYGLVCGRTNSGPFLRRGTVALMTSKDLISWEVKEPIFNPTQYFNLECPQLYKINDYYYIIASTMEDSAQRYWVSKDINGPYLTLGDNRLMPANSHYAGRLALFKGKHIFCCWTKSFEDGPSPYGLRSERGGVVKYVPSPLEIKQYEDGRLTLIASSAWESYEKTDSKSFIMENYYFINGNHTAEFDASSLLMKVESGMEIVASQIINKNFKLEGQIYLEAAKGGLGFHLNKESAGYFLEIIPEENRIRLIRHLKAVIADENEWFDYKVLQEKHVNFGKLDTQGIMFMLRVVGGEIEFSLNNQVIISTVSVAKMEGNIGFFADCGAIRLENLKITEMNVPSNI